MIIRKVELENILSHEKTEVAFSDGVVSIVGPNGAGKSAIVEAVYLALMVDGRPDIRGGKTEFIVTRGRRSGRIAVHLEIGGSRYLVVRELDAGGSSRAYLYDESGRLRLTGAPNLVKEVARLLGLPTHTPSELRRLVRATVFSLQDELTQIIDVEDSERKRWVLSLLGLSYLERALEAFRAVIRDERSRLRGELESKRGILDKAKRDLEKLARDLSGAEEKYAKLLKEKERLDGEVRVLRERLDLIERAIDAAIGLKRTLTLRRLVELEGLVGRLGIVKDWYPDLYARVAAEVANLRGNLQRVEGELKGFLERARETLGVPVEKLEELRRDVERSIITLKEQEGGYRKHLELLKDFLIKFELGDRCPVCGSKIANPESVKAHLAGEVSDIEKNLKRVRRELEELEEKRRLVDDALRDLRGLLSEKEGAEKSLRERERELEDLNRRAEGLCASAGVGIREIGECVQHLKKLREEVIRADRELEILRRQLRGETTDASADPEKQYSELVSLLDKLGLRPPPALSTEHLSTLRDGELDRLRRDLEIKLREALDRSGRLGNEIEGLKGSIEKTRELVGKLREDVDRYERDIRDLERMAKTLDLLEAFGEEYLGKDGRIARSLTRAVKEGLERKANRVLSRLGLPSIAVKDDFQILVKVPGGEVPIRNASGGERVGASIALRLALAELVMGRSPTSLVLDEPTVYLDDERRELVFEIVRELSRSLKQLIVVTHDDAVISISDRVVLVEKAGGVSRVVQGEAT